MRLLLAAVTGCALLSCARPAQPAHAPRSSPRPAPRAHPHRSSLPRPVPTASPVPASPPPRRPVPLRAAASAPAILPPAAPPEIIALELRSRVVHPGERVVGRVVASSNVASVEVRIGGYSIAMEKTGVGRFALSYVVPDVPFLRGTFVMQVIARNSGGASVERSLPLEIR